MVFVWWLFFFRAEAKTMDRMYLSLGNDFARINLPQSRLSTKRLLVMSYLEVNTMSCWATKALSTWYFNKTAFDVWSGVECCLRHPFVVILGF